jgi:hypothetical protein
VREYLSNLKNYGDRIDVMKNRKRMNWQDMYYDGLLDAGDMFCEETQTVYHRDEEDGYIDEWSLIVNYRHFENVGDEE